MDLKQALVDCLGEKNILSKCSENKYNLKGINNNFYYIMDGDNIKTKPEKKSVDCIIIDSREKY